jgi:hypothetical protein
MFARRLFCGVVMACLLVGSVGALTNDRRAYMTFSGPVRLPGVTLPAGTYTFELAAPDTARNLVRVTNRQHTQVYYTGFTQLTQRSSREGLETKIVLGEAPAHSIQPIRVWFPQDEVIGNEFIY